MSTIAPSSYKVMEASNELARVRDMLLAICPEIEEDQQLFADMIEGEAYDALRVIERLIEASIETDALADAVRVRKADITARLARFERRRDACRTVALRVLESINLRRLERPTFTVSVANRPPHILITDQSALDEIYIRVTREPDKDAIKAGLRNGEEVRGAVLSNGGTGLTVRTK